MTQVKKHAMLVKKNVRLVTKMDVYIVKLEDKITHLSVLVLMDIQK
jgi:hypothetical protein